MRFPDIPFEAAVLRAALLTGLVREHHVAAWAMERLATTGDFIGELSQVVLAPEELTAQREALSSLAAQRVGEAVEFALRDLALEDLRDGRHVRGCLRILSDLRREGFLPSDVAVATKELEDRANLADVGMAGVVAPTRAEIVAVIATGLEEPCYIFTFAKREEAVAFVAALARRIVSERRWNDEVSHVWEVADTFRIGDRPALVLDAPAWRIARHAFGPLPVSSAIPYFVALTGLTLLFETESAVALGLEEATLIVSEIT